MDKIGKYEGSHVYIFDSPEMPSKIVLVKSNSIKQTTTPGFGQKENLSFEEAAIKYTEMQTGLIVDDLTPLVSFKPPEPVKEPSGIVQYVDVMNFLAWRVEPRDIESRVIEYQKTEDGKKYQPRLIEIAKLNEVKDLAPEIPRILKRHFSLQI
jgi:hypothetical protein